MNNQESVQERTEEEIHRDAIGLETKPELMNPPDAPREDENDTLEPDGGEEGDDTEPGTGVSIGQAGSRALPV
ncbi:hypothetical protein GCM10028803_06450 [Larkinella knui]|uniref:Uncharacterized protein n=1 Tax=Larkinella knui TaxID=2025310 RepID=A0A3P1CKE5_9BACT|nr:hypothetical protein [Larkinella knui]RRB13680.1 hypothetical protein EHT87_15585 [Larkinella knui]